VTAGRRLDDPVDEAALLDENARLQQRVADLEMIVAGYREQLGEVVGSTSWRVTSPLRAFAFRARAARSRIRRIVARLRSADSRSVAARTVGLFPPSVGALPLTSPLRRPFDASTVRRDPAQVPPVGLPRILVAAHVHYPELWADIEDRLVRVPEEFDVVVTVTVGAAETVVPAINARYPRARVVVVPNRGRDWAPLVHLANAGLLNGYAAVAKVHTKKSQHRLDGDGWRTQLLDGIFESPDAIRRIVDLLDEDRSVGMVVPTGHVSGVEHWGSNQGIVEMLASRLPMAFDPDDLAFAAGSMFWCRPWLLERIADLAIDVEDFEPETGQFDGTTAHALERIVGILATVGGMDIVETIDVPSRLRSARRAPVARARVLAFYLPQYHQCRENDEFWGEGFTDWRKVEAAQPQFTGHRQPLRPGVDVGQYDLADPLELPRQAEQVKAAGIDGLVFHYYWFDGRTPLDLPLNRLLAEPAIDLPFALSWANEPWTRRWDGLDSDVLLDQAFAPGWPGRFYASISPALQDPRYLTVEGKPLLLVYRLDLVPDLSATVAAWRSLALADGLPGLHVLGVTPSRDFGSVDPSALASLDGLVTFPPGSGLDLVCLSQVVPAGSALGAGQVLSYDAAADSPIPNGLDDMPVHPGVMPGWDNTARRGSRAYVFHGGNPVTFRRWLARAVESAGRQRLPLVFVNAWNEWAEGAVLEPSQHAGGGYLATVLDARPGEPEC
jgi:lipopolysaccharide biosynthesis protein